MSILIKSETEIEKMRIAGKLAAEVLEMIEPYVVPDVTTDELNQICHDYIVNVQNAIPAPLNYGLPPFPKSICTSINEVVCHGIPSPKVILKSTFKPGKYRIIIHTIVYHGLPKGSPAYMRSKNRIYFSKLLQVL